MQRLPSENQNLLQKDMIRAIATKGGSDPLFRDLDRVEVNSTVMANPLCLLDAPGERKPQLTNYLSQTVLWPRQWEHFLDE